MSLYVIGVNYKTAPVEMLEKFSIDAREYERVLSGIRQLDGVTECALLSTCNRTELHIFSDNTLLDAGCIESRLCNLKGMNISQMKKYFYFYEGIGAIKHIIKVASGMDSMILGEDQILSQFKKAYEISMKQGTSKAVLNTLSRLAITTSKKIKTRNHMLGRVSSIAGKVSELLAGLFDNKLADKNVLIIGSGEIGSMVAEELLRVGVAGICMTKRSRCRTESAVKNELDVRAVSYDDRYTYIEQCDIIIGATSSPHYTVTGDMLEKRIKNRDRRYVFIDLAVPRDFDESINQIDNALLYNMDDIKNLASRKSKGGNNFDFSYIHEQINCHADEFIKWFKYRKALSLPGEV